MHRDNVITLHKHIDYNHYSDYSGYNTFISKVRQNFTTRHMSSASSRNTISAISRTITVLIDETVSKKVRFKTRC